MTQGEKVMCILRQGLTITQRDAFEMGILRLSAVVHELRKDGAEIKVERKMVKNRDGSKSSIAVYSL